MLETFIQTRKDNNGENGSTFEREVEVREIETWELTVTLSLRIEKYESKIQQMVRLYGYFILGAISIFYRVVTVSNLSYHVIIFWKLFVLLYRTHIYTVSVSVHSQKGEENWVLYKAMTLINWPIEIVS